jgi:hypothetical protein
LKDINKKQGAFLYSVTRCFENGEIKAQNTAKHCNMATKAQKDK